MKSKLTATKEITRDTKEKVLERQHHRSISGVALPSSAEFHHYIFRSASGVGFEWNVIALTPEEHRAVHDRQPIKVNGRVRYQPDEFDTLMRNHLIINYSGWSVDNCKYKKYKDEEEYGVVRRDKKL